MIKTDFSFIVMIFIVSKTSILYTVFLKRRIYRGGLEYFLYGLLHTMDRKNWMKPYPTHYLLYHSSSVESPKYFKYHRETTSDCRKTYKNLSLYTDQKVRRYSDRPVSIIVGYFECLKNCRKAIIS